MRKRATWLAIGLVVGIFLSTAIGCCTSDVRESVKVWREDYSALDGLVVPDPTLPPELQARVDILRERLRAHLNELSDYVGVKAEEGDD